MSLAASDPPTVGSRGLRIEAVGPAFNVALAFEMRGAERTVTTNFNLNAHELAGSRARDVLPDLRFLSGFPAPNHVSISIRNRGAEVATGSIDVANLLAKPATLVTQITMQVAELLSDLDGLLGLLMLMPSAVDQQDIETLTWARTLARGELVEATWSEGKVIAERPEELETTLRNGGALRIDKFECFRFAGSDYPLGIISQVLFGATIRETRMVESGTEVVLRADDGRAEERLLLPYAPQTSEQK